MASEVEPVGVEGEDYFRVEKYGREIIVPIRKDGETYHSDPQIRALQLVHEGRLGGPGRGQGRRRQPRAAEYVAEEVRKRGKKIVRALDAGLKAESVRTRMEAAGMMLKIERDEALLQLKEEEADLDHQSKEELVATLIQLVSEPSTEAALEAVIDLPPEAIKEVSGESTEDSDASGQNDRVGRTGTTGNSSANGPNGSKAGRNGGKPGKRDCSRDSNPWTTAAHGRSTDG